MNEIKTFERKQTQMKFELIINRGRHQCMSCFTPNSRSTLAAHEGIKCIAFHRFSTNINDFSTYSFRLIDEARSSFQLIAWDYNFD